MTVSKQIACSIENSMLHVLRGSFDACYMCYANQNEDLSEGGAVGQGGRLQREGRLQRGAGVAGLTGSKGLGGMDLRSWSGPVSEQKCICHPS